MVIRPATMGDLAGVYDLMLDMHARSKYAGDTAVDAGTARAMLMQCVQRHGGKNNGSTHFVVAANDDGVEGFMIGALQRLYLICNRLEAMDMFLYAKADANPRSGIGLMKSYIEWAEGCPKVASIKLSYTDALDMPSARLDALYGRAKGFKRHGAIYERVMA